jgi:hypothetical protein
MAPISQDLEPPANAGRFTPSPFRLRRNSVLKLNRIRNNGMRCLSDDNEGRRFLMVLLALDLLDDDIPNRAPWVTALELRELEQEAARFNPTPAAIGKVLKLTDAERERHALWNLRPYDVDWKTVQRRREVDKVARRKQKRHQARTELAATANHDPRTIAVMEAMALHPHGASVLNIMTDAAKALPKERATCHRIVHRILDRLEQKGLVETWCSGQPGKLVRYCKMAMTPMTPQNSPKLVEDQRLTQNVAVTPAKISKRIGGATANQPWRMTDPSAEKPGHDVVGGDLNAETSQPRPSVPRAPRCMIKTMTAKQHAIERDACLQRLSVHLTVLHQFMARQYGDATVNTAIEDCHHREQGAAS